MRGGAGEDYARLTGKVYGQDGKEITGATVRVDATGKVYATLPKGATGAKDDAKPQQVKVELIANPRDTDSVHDSYRNPQILRVENPTSAGSTNSDQPTSTSRTRGAMVAASAGSTPRWPRSTLRWRA